MKFGLAAVHAAASIAAVGVSANLSGPPEEPGLTKAVDVSNLLQRALHSTENSRLGRRLEKNANEVAVDVSGYSLRFERCQSVKSYRDDLAGGGNHDDDDDTPDTVLATTRRNYDPVTSPINSIRNFVIFRLCPNGSCDTSCASNFGEHIADLGDYLEATVPYQRNLQNEMCEACRECDTNVSNMNDDDTEEGQDDALRRRRLPTNTVDCDSCYEECRMIETMEDYGYIDAATFVECTHVYDPCDDDDGDVPLYAGPVCASHGSKIKIGLFTDVDCTVPYNSYKTTVDDYIMDENGVGMRLSHALLKKVYSSDCISCHDDDEEEDEDDDEQESGVLEMCEQLHEAAAKCETTNGFDHGRTNQLAKEDIVCDFVESLKAGNYDGAGAIEFVDTGTDSHNETEELQAVADGSGSSTGSGAATTRRPKLGVAFAILEIAGLVLVIFQF